MKYLVFFIVIALVAVLVYALLFTDWIISRKEPVSDEIPEDVLEDGYMKDNSSTTVPKSVESEKIREFSLVFSTLSWTDEQYFKEGIYRLEAKKTNERVYVKYEFNPYYGDREIYQADTDADFLISLDKLIKEYRLAQFNGKNIFVSGLPDMYGEQVEILYESGETVYASDNQDGFIGRDALLQIEKLFLEEAKSE